ncbi:ABC transporter ATP-binding protein [Planomonospora venezuelensis]|uniref:Oligopeptide transport system ATP-binding protein n=2 Tax=Planomonospora venezuelensis TaxID=1999 RepID=A0A841D3J7_PLAVE|nr:oligopeptide transport system ATP-binding protein [Planomonospora venezuelensis]GIN00524.1 ABC transporter ATP-binding protein [Planomonospora venezuelensis]
MSMTSMPPLPAWGAPESEPLLAVEDLHVEFVTRQGTVKAVNGVGYALHPGETLAVLGESGSGKSVTAQAIMGILDTPPARVPKGRIRFRGTDLLGLSEDARSQVRGSRIAMIFQDALSALNPVFTVGSQIAEMFRVHRGMSRRDAERRAVELMDRVRIPGARQRLHDYPHQFSGGMRQRIMIAMAIALDPEVLIADEPTTALDVTVQAQIMELLAELKRESDMGLILITHDLGVVADVADKIVVMYGGRVVENAPVHDLYRAPAHPYTRGLLDSIPRIDRKGRELHAIAGMPPNLLDMPPGCAFAPRCPYRQDDCVTAAPPLHRIGSTRGSACHYWREVLDGSHG